MTTDEFQAEQARRYAQQRKQDWQHKQHLDSLSSFTQRFEYWKNEVCKHDLRGTINYDDFILSIEPSTEEERSLLHQFHFEWYRSFFIRERWPVKKSNGKPAPHERANEGDTAFEVQSLDELKSDLAARVSIKLSSLERTILLQDELTFVTNAIDSACDPIEIYDPLPHELTEIIPAIKGEVKHLRGAIRRGKYCYLAAHTSYQDQKTIQLAQVWDIVHYECFLQNEITKQEHTKYGYVDTKPFSKEASNKDRNPTIARRALNVFDTEIEKIAKESRNTPRPSISELARKAISNYSNRIQQAGLNGQTEKSICRYLKDLGYDKTAKQYAERKIRDTLSDKNVKLSY